MRKLDWPNRLNKYFLSVKNERFDDENYGTFNCAIFTGGAVKAITGIDHLAEFTGKYRTKEEADVILKTIGNGSLLKTIRKKFGPPVHGAFGQRGDIAWYDGACGIIIGSTALFIRDVHGFGTAKISKIKWAFKV